MSRLLMGSVGLRGDRQGDVARVGEIWKLEHWRRQEGHVVAAAVVHHTGPFCTFVAQSERQFWVFCLN